MVTVLNFTEIDMGDFILEAMTVIAYLFVLIMIFYAKKKNKIFGAKPFPLLLVAVLLGFLSGSMDLLSEFLWFDKELHYNIFKSTMQILKISSLVLFAISMLWLFEFTKFLMGETEE